MIVNMTEGLAGRVDVKSDSWSGRAWLIRARGTETYRLQNGSWGPKTSPLIVKLGSERDAQAWWSFHGDAVLVWFEEA